MYTQGGTLTTPIEIRPNSPLPVPVRSRQTDRGISISMANFKILLDEPPVLLLKIWTNLKHCATRQIIKRKSNSHFEVRH